MRAAMPRAASSAGVARPTPALLVARGINVSHACLIFKEKRDCLQFTTKCFTTNQELLKLTHKNCFFTTEAMHTHPTPHINQFWRISSVCDLEIAHFRVAFCHVSKRFFVQNHSILQLHVHFHVNQTCFHFCTKTRFETEAQAN